MKTNTGGIQVQGTDSPKKNNDWPHALLLGIAAVVSGGMSYWGAQELLQNMFYSLPFAILVQGTILLAIWEMYRYTGVRAAMLYLAWAVAAVFSIFSAFLLFDVNNSQSMITDFKGGVMNYVSEINGSVTSLEGAYKDAEKVAKNEGLTGEGPEWRKKIGTAEILKGKWDKAKSLIDKSEVKKVVDNLDSVTSIEDMKKISSRLTMELGADPLFSSIPKPKILKFSESPVQRVINWLKSLSDITSDNYGESVGKLMLASMMEVIAFLVAMARLVDKKPSDPRTLRMRVTSMLAKLVDFSRIGPRIYEEANNEENTHKKVIEENGVSTSAQKRAKRPSRTPRSSTKNDIKAWEQAIVLQAGGNSVSQMEIINKVMNDHQLSSSNTLSVDFLSDYPTVKNTAIRTGVLTESKTDNGHERGKNFNAWYDFHLQYGVSVMEAATFDQISGNDRRKPQLRRAA